MLRFFYFFCFFGFILSGVFESAFNAQESPIENLEDRIQVRIELNTGSMIEGYLSEKRFYEEKTFTQQNGRFSQKTLTLWFEASGSAHLNVETFSILGIEKVIQAPIKEIKLPEATQALATSRFEHLRISSSLSSQKEEEVSPEELKRFEAILKQFPLEHTSLSQVLHQLKLRMHYRIPLSQEMQDFLIAYPLWRKAIQHQKKIPPLQHYTSKELELANELLLLFPVNTFQLKPRLKKIANQARFGIPLRSEEVAWFALLEEWLDAQEILELHQQKEEKRLNTEKTKEIRK
jgi:hypothetical protein